MGLFDIRRKFKRPAGARSPYAYLDRGVRLNVYDGPWGGASISQDSDTINLTLDEAKALRNALNDLIDDLS
jgi:hypothetical protein